MSNFDHAAYMVIWRKTHPRRSETREERRERRRRYARTPNARLCRCFCGCQEKGQTSPCGFCREGIHESAQDRP